MKLIELVAVVALVAPFSVLAQSGDMKGMDHKSMPEGDMKGMDHKLMAKGEKDGATHSATGTVKSLDPKAGTVTLAHDPVKSLKWPAMTMTFKVKDKALLDKLQADKKVNVDFVQQGKDYVVTAVK